MTPIKHILIFAPDYLPHVGGAEIAVKEITDRMQGEYSFTMLVPRLQNLSLYEKVGVIEVCRLGFGISFDKFIFPFLAVLKAFSISRKKPFFLYWAIMASYGGIAASFFKLFGGKGAFLLTLQEGDTEEHLKRYVFGSDFFYRFLVRPFHTLPIRKADSITVISSYLKGRAVEAGAKSSIAIVRNGVNTDLFSVKSRSSLADRGFSISFRKSERLALSDREKLRDRFGFTIDDIVIITTSRLVEKNGVGDLIEAMRYLPDHVKLIIIGDGYLREKLYSLVSKLALSDRVKFLGNIPHSDIPDYLHASDIFARPSLSEGMGNSFIEAMAAGVPVIGTPVGGIVDFLTDGETGLLCESKNPKSIAEKIMWYMENPKEREIIVQNALDLV